MRRALLYATFNGVANCTNGIGRQTKTILSTIEHRWQELTAQTGPFTPFLAIPEPGPNTWAYDPAQLATAQRIITARGGEVVGLRHDLAAAFWTPPVWKQLSDGAARTALRLADTYDQVLVIAVDTPFIGTGQSYLDAHADPDGKVTVLLTPYGTTHIHDHPDPDPIRLAWEIDGLAATSRPGVYVADVGDYLTTHLVDAFGVDASRLVRWRSSLDLTSPDLAPMPRQQAEQVAASFGVPLDRPIVLTIGRTDPVKGFDLLIDALIPLADEVHLVAIIVPFSQDDPLLADYRAQIGAAGLRATMVAAFTRDLPRALAALPSTKVVVCPSRGETLANVPLEVALWAREGGPVVLAPDLGGFPEQITAGVTGLLYPPHQPHALTTGITRALCLDDDRRRRVIHAAWKEVIEHRDIVGNLAHTLEALSCTTDSIRYAIDRPYHGHPAAAVIGAHHPARGRPAVTPLFVVDGHHLLYRAWFGFPSRIMSRDKTRDLTGVFGFLALARKAHAICEPDAELVVVFDGENATAVRTQADASYKANRATADHTPIRSLARVKEALDAAAVRWVELDAYEGDDVIATLAGIAIDSGRRVTCYSGDRDFVQLLVHPTFGLLGPNRHWLTAEDVTRRWAVLPRQWPDYRALTGDPADNIPGIPGIGPKTAATLLADGRHLDDLVGSPRLRQPRCRAVVDRWTDVLTWRDLIRLNGAVPIPPQLLVGAPTPTLPRAAHLLDQIDLW